MTSGDKWTGPRSRRARERLAASVEWPAACHKCGGLVERGSRWHLDHDPPRKLTPEWSWDDPRTHFVAHARCNMREGAVLANAVVRQPVAPRFVREVPVLPRWWPADCAPGVEGAVWPAVWSGVDPRAVGTLGPEVARWVLERTGVTLSWWQRFVCATAFQVGADGRLLMDQVGVSTARQVGKSWLLRALALWRISNADRFGEPQLVLSVANSLNTAEEVFNPALNWADAQDGYRARRANGKAEVTCGESRWLPRSTRTGFGFSVSTALCDEVWSIHPDVVWQMLEPTMVARDQAQIWLFSTAHNTPTELWAHFVREPQQGRAVMLWQADHGLPLDDRDGWRQASPVWSEQRERIISRALGSVDSHSFSTQWLNRWPVESVERWIPSAQVDAVRGDARPVRPTVGGLDRGRGGGVWSAVRAELANGRVVIETFRTERLDEVTAWLARVPVVLVSRTVSEMIPDGTLQLEVVGAHVEVAAVDLFAASVRERRVTWSDEPILLEQIHAARVRAVPGGNKLDVSRSGETDLLRAALWVNHRLGKNGNRSFGIVVSPR